MLRRCKFPNLQSLILQTKIQLFNKPNINEQEFRTNQVKKAKVINLPSTFLNFTLVFRYMRSISITDRLPYTARSPLSWEGSLTFESLCTIYLFRSLPLSNILFWVSRFGNFVIVIPNCFSFAVSYTMLSENIAHNWYWEMIAQFLV